MDKESLPRICYILGGEDNPIKINEEFKFEDLRLCYAIDSGGNMIENCNGYGWINMWNQKTLENMINHPEKIIRHLQFSNDEKAFLRLLYGLGLKYIARDESNENR